MSHRYTKVVMVVFVALLVAGLPAGCNLAPPPKKERVEKAPKKIPKVSAEKVTVPAAWPKDVPLYPGAEIVSATLTASGQSLMLRTEDTAAEVFNWYYDQLGLRQWKMHRPMLDVARNVASINGSLEGRTLSLRAGTSETEEGYTSLSVTTEPLLKVK